MTLTEQAIATIAAGCEGVTEGPWKRVELPDAGETMVLVAERDNEMATVRWYRGNGSSAHRDAAHIARLDPATVLALCALAQQALQSRREGQQMREATIEECAKVALRDVDWSMFKRQSKLGALTGEETNILAPPLHPDDTFPSDANVFAYKIGLAAGEVIASTIRALSHPKPESVK